MNKRRVIFVSLLVSLVVVAGVVFFIFPFTYGADWWDVSFAYRIKITFNNAAVSENLVNFPVPVVFNSSEASFWSHVNRTTGSDMRFVDADNTTELYFEIEKFDITNNASVIWVKVPQIDSSSTTDFIWLYYGNSTTAFDNYYNSASVYDANYMLVYHLNETSGYFLDATANRNNCTVNSLGSNAYGATGNIDGAISFNGTAGNQQASDSATLRIAAGASTTIEAWIKNTQGSSSQGFIFIKQAAPTGYYYLKVGDPTAYNKAICRFYDTTNGGIVASSTSVNTNNWAYLTGVKVGAIASIFVNAVNETTGIAGNNAIASTANLYVGSTSTPDRWFNGTMDELRISNIQRSNTWIKACYQYEVDQTKFTIAPEEAGNVGPTVSSCDFTSPLYRGDYGWINVTVNDDNGLADIATVDTQLTTPLEFVVMRYTRSTNVFSETSDLSNICTLDLATSNKLNVSATSFKASYYLKLSTPAALGSCDVNITVTDATGLTGTGTYPKLTLASYYLQVSIMYGNGTTNSTGTNAFDSNTTPTIEATTGSGYNFTLWVLEGSSVNTTNPIPVLINSNHTLAAIFTIPGSTTTTIYPPGGPTWEPNLPPIYNLGTYDILVVVRDMYYDPLQSADVVLKERAVNETDLLMGKTDEFGKFQIDNYPAGHTYTVQVSYVGRTQDQTILLDSDKALYFEFDKSPDWLALIGQFFNNIVTEIGNFLTASARFIGLTLKPTWSDGSDPAGLGYLVMVAVAVPSCYLAYRKLKPKVRRYRKRRKR